MRKQHKMETRNAKKRREIRSVDSTTVETKLKLSSEGLHLALLKMERAKTVGQETLQFEFSV